MPCITKALTKALLKKTSFQTKKWLCVGVCTGAILLLATYGALIAMDLLPESGEEEKKTADKKKQEIFAKAYDAIFHLAGIIGCLRESEELTMVFLILTGITKIQAIFEALGNAYFWPYLIWSCLVSLFGGLFYVDLKALKRETEGKCPHCTHCLEAGSTPAQ